MVNRPVPFCHITLTARKPPLEPYLAYPARLETWGDHIRKRRLELKLTAKEVGQRIGIGLYTVFDWEYHRTDPHPRCLPEIVKFLGYEPDVFVRQYFGEKILAYRKSHRISQKQFTLMLGIHQTTLRQWEKNEKRPSKKFLGKLLRILEAASPETGKEK